MPLRSFATTNRNLFVTSLLKVINTKLSSEDTSKVLRRIQIPAPNTLSLDSTKNALLLEFKGEDESAKPSSLPSGSTQPMQSVAKYRLLLVLSMFDIEDIFDDARLAIHKTIQSTHANRVIIWTISRFDSMRAQSLKADQIDLVHLSLPSAEEEKQVIRNFVHLESISYEILYCLNVLANRIIKRLRKKFHLVLSELAAATYDDKYGKDKFATESLMNFEEELLNKILDELFPTGGELAIDVGCGTGRHSFILAKRFKHVLGFDFSSKMIKVARDRSTERDIPNVSFEEYDFEYERLAEEKEIFGRADFICASFGMGSFIENTKFMLRKFSNWLKPEGKAYLSFYNARSIALNVVPNWRDSSLTTKINTEKQTLEVVNAGARFEIFCLPFNEAVHHIIQKSFLIKSVWSFPTTLAILPNSLFSNQIAKDVFLAADKGIAPNENLLYGHYAMILAQKLSPPSAGYQKAMQILSSNECDYEIIEHDPVISLKDVLTQLSLDPQSMVKTVIFRVRRSQSKKKLIGVILPINKTVDRNYLANQLGAPVWSFQLASEKEISKHLGFPLGGIAPFGFLEPIECFIDENLLAVETEYYNMGIGDNSKTLKLSKKDFSELTRSYGRINLLPQSSH